jgi:hypothetical protein
VYIAVVKCSEDQSRQLKLIGLELKLLTPENDPGGKYHGWHQVAGPKEHMDRLRDWLTRNNTVERKFF